MARTAAADTAPSGRLRVVGYCRVSTDKQGDRGHGLEAQRAALAQHCATYGYELLTVTTDVVSGGNVDGMHGRAVAIAAIEAGVADALLVRALDRVTRSQLDAATLYDRAERNGWRLLDCDKADSGDPSQRLLADVRIAMAAEEKRKISERTREGLAKARRNGVTLGRRPEVDADTAKRIVRMRTRNKLSANAIAERFTADGVRAPRGGSRWHASTVRGVLAREGVA
ncbi:recombinase family protein [Mycolicibacterium lacusdiani]|uniref:recombinase family protein n=1 Tax=Mycolicibacterium lacusdiani TaxID=2895283 RepID=UPI00201C10DB|nr:recombinase family protein [Mycolicibacterium lacusdiani]